MRRIPAYYLIDFFSDDDEDEKKGEKKEEKPKEEQKDAQTAACEKKEEPKAEPPRELSFRTRSVITRRNGVEHIRKEVYDSTTGKTTLFETRKIGDKSMTLKRETDKDGNVNEEETHENLADEELEAFKSQWLTQTGAKAVTSEKAPEQASLKEPAQKEEEKEKEDPKTA